MVETELAQAEATVKDFVIVGAHIKPTEVVKELNHLYDVHDEVAAEYGTQVTIFGAPCG